MIRRWNSGWFVPKMAAGIVSLAAATLCSDLPAADFNGLTIEELLGETLSAEELDLRIEAAVKTAGESERGDALLDPLDALIRNAELWPSHEIADDFFKALLKYGDTAEVAARVPKLLKYSEAEFNPSATEKLNLGIMLAFRFGGVSFEDLRPLTRLRNADLEWLLPALGKTGEKRALPLIRPHRADESIVPLGSGHTIRTVPSAALLGAAYAGDEDALGKILDIHDRDVESLPRFAFYVSWGRSEGLDVRDSERLVAHCEHRIQQAERLLDHLGRSVRPVLIERAVNRGAPAALGYLLHALESAPAEQCADFIDLLEFPEPSLRMRVSRRLWKTGSESIRTEILDRLRSLVSSSSGLDRLYAVTMLCERVPAEGREIAEQARANESNFAVRVRLEDAMSWCRSNTP